MRKKIEIIFKWSRKNKIKAKLVVLSVLWIIIILVWGLFTFAHRNEVISVFSGGGPVVPLGSSTGNY